MTPPFLMQAKVGEGTKTMLTQATIRLGHTHTASVQEPWALVVSSIGTMVGGTKCISFFVWEQLPNGVE